MIANAVAAAPRPLLAGSVEFLENAYDEREGLFSFSTRFRDGRLLQDFDHPHTHRYTVNSLLGLQRAALVEPGAPWSGVLPGAIDRFLERQYGRLANPGDLGLLAVLLAGGDHDRPLRGALGRIREAADADGAGLDMQDLGWMLWGACAAARAGESGAEPLAHDLYRTIVTRFVDSRTGLPRHTLGTHRAHVVSFGSIVYYLRSLWEYASTFDVDDAHGRFAAGVARVLQVQGPLGEWPWLLGVATGRPLDFYPVFSVHQDAMAMLFLLPYRDAGRPDAAAAIDRSFRWILGENQLGVSMVRERPFMIYRSIERRDRLPRARRYVRSLVRSRLDRPASCDERAVRVNDESRSYHLGWILYAWAGRDDVPRLDAPAKA